jgi:tetratricopeptide (TPR) repeat protein
MSRTFAHLLHPSAQPRPRPGRAALVWLVALTALVAALALPRATAPLLGVLGYELSLVVSLPAALAGLHLGAGLIAVARRQGRSTGDAAEARPFAWLLRCWAQSTGATWLCLMGPALLVLVEGIWVPQCGRSDGALFWLLLPHLSAAVGAATGLVCALLLERGAVRLGLLLIAGSLAWTGWRFYDAPPIFLTNPFGGWFSGTLYDEGVVVSMPLLWARLTHLVGAAAAIACCALFVDGTGGLRLRLRAFRWEAAPLVLALCLVGAAALLFSQRAAAGWALSSTDIAERLGGELHTRHFVLHYDPSGPWARELELHALDHEHRFFELEALLGSAPDRPIHSFLFSSPAEKRQLMGAQETFIAKPWRGEIYLHPDGWPHGVLAHELAHVFAASFGDALFGIARRGAQINVGLIEGLAVAAAWERAPLDPDETVRVLLDAGIEPQLERALSLGFLGLNASAAYAVAGSFCRFVLTRHGARALGAIYRAGGAPEAYLAATGQSFSALEQAWLEHLRSTAVAPPATIAASVVDQLRRKPIFGRPCAHVVAARRKEAYRALDRGETAQGLALLSRSCSDVPDDPEPLLALQTAALELGSEGQQVARQAAESLRRHPKASAAQRARALLALADLDLLANDLTAARASLEAALELPLDEPTRRSTLAKRATLALFDGSPEVARPLLRYFSPVRRGPLADDPTATLVELERLRQTAPRFALPAYLVGRQLEGRGRPAEAKAALEQALAAEVPLPDLRFVDESERLLGRCLFKLGDRPEARARFDALRLRAGRSDFEAKEWLSRLSLVEARPDLAALLSQAAGKVRP